MKLKQQPFGQARVHLSKSGHHATTPHTPYSLRSLTYLSLPYRLAFVI